MTTDKSNLQVNPKPLPSWARPFAIASALVYLLSLVFPVGAALSNNTASFPQWWGPLDVGIAFILGLLALVLLALVRGKIAQPIQDLTYRAYRILLHLILALLVVFQLFGDHIIWINGLPGIAWRAWLLLYCLPAWCTLFQSGAAHVPNARSD